MGGMVPLGYDLKDRRLLMNETEAETVRLIFRRYLELGSVNALREWLEQAGVRSKAWTARNGRRMGGVVISRGGLFHILSNRLYLGEIPHKGKVHPGLHQAIIETDVFECVQQMLRDNRAADRSGPRKSVTAVLAGRVFDSDGHPFSPSFGYGKRGHPYRYYIALDLQLGRRRRSQDDRIRRVNGEVLEGFVRDAIRRLTNRRDIAASDLPAIVRRVELGATSTELVIDARSLLGNRPGKLALEEVRARLGSGERLAREPGEEAAFRLALPIRFQMRGGRTWIEGARNPAAARRLNRGLVEALRSAHQELHELRASPLTPLRQLADARAPDDQHRRQVSRLAFLAPDLQEMILEGRQPSSLRLRTLLKTNSRSPGRISGAGSRTYCPTQPESRFSPV